MNAPTSPSSVYSYGASSSVGSYASSHASTVASSAPPRRDPSSVDDRIMGLRPTQKRYELPCEFLLLTGCRETFQDGEETAWMEHVEGHLQGKFPTKLQCCKIKREGFCETLNFDARHFCGDKPENFRRRMEHIREHIVGEGDKAFDMRPDGGLIRHLRHERIISSREYEAIMDRLAPKNVPPVPGGWHVERIEEVEEEPYSTYRDKKKKGRPESSKKKGSRK
ncbi:hypothetical protein SLS53_001295 [Cytospora paraplurivora]|uniref:Uncharacterized protein n=1 Tax=Cytospora paraplurivora TaxID=2898453 RepID=A0AAN9UT10_9PEZI